MHLNFQAGNRQTMHHHRGLALQKTSRCCPSIHFLLHSVGTSGDQKFTVSPVLSTCGGPGPVPVLQDSVMTKA